MNRLVRNVISTVQEVAFDYSAKKLHAFFDERDADATTKEHMEERTALQTLCEMRCPVVQLLTFQSRSWIL
jgi:methionine salvage enolase-phosphatase E1